MGLVKVIASFMRKTMLEGTKTNNLSFEVATDKEMFCKTKIRFLNIHFNLGEMASKCSFYYMKSGCWNLDRV